MNARQLALAGLEPQPVRDWIVKITHPADAAGDYGPMPKTVALEIARAWPHPCSIFPHKLIPTPVLVGHLSRLTSSDEEKEAS